MTTAASTPARLNSKISCGGAAYDWECKVHAWEGRKRRERVIDGLGVVRGMVKCCRESELTDLALFLSINSHRVADEWADVSG